MFDLNSIVNNAINAAVNVALEAHTKQMLEIIHTRDKEYTAEIERLHALIRNIQTPDITVPISNSVANMPEVPIVSYVQGLEVRVSKLTNEVEQLQERSSLDWDFIKEEHITPAIRSAINDLDLSDTIREQVEELDLTNKMKAALEDLISDEVESQLNNIDLSEQVQEAISNIDWDYEIDFDQKVSDALENADFEEKIEEALSNKNYVDSDALSEAIQSEVREMFSNARITF